MTPLDAIRRALDASNGSAKAFQAELAEAGFIVVSAAHLGEKLGFSPTKAEPAYTWSGPGPEPARWTAADGTVVYRSYSDYVAD